MPSTNWVRPVVRNLRTQPTIGSEGPHHESTLGFGMQFHSIVCVTSGVATVGAALAMRNDTSTQLLRRRQPRAAPPVSGTLRQAARLATSSSALLPLRGISPKRILRHPRIGVQPIAGRERNEVRPDSSAARHRSESVRLQGRRRAGRVCPEPQHGRPRTHAGLAQPGSAVGRRREATLRRSLPTFCTATSRL